MPSPIRQDQSFSADFYLSSSELLLQSVLMQQLNSTASFPWTGRLHVLATEVARRLGSEWNAKSVWLFGSSARGEDSKDSDIDVLVVVGESAEPRYRRAQKAHRIVSDLRVPKDIVVLTQEEWDSQLKVPVSLASTVSAEGILLYGAA